MGPGQGERAGAQFRAQDPSEMALGVPQPRGQPGHAVPLDHAVADQPHRTGGEVGAHVPVGRARHGVGQAATAGAEAAELGRGRRRPELDVGALGRDRRAGRAAVDAGGADGRDELPVEPRVARGHGSVAAVVVENHKDDAATRRKAALAGIGRDGRSGQQRWRRLSSGPNWIAAQPSSRSMRRTRSIMSPCSTAGTRRDEWQECHCSAKSCHAASRDYPGVPCPSPSASSACPTSASRRCSMH